MRPDFDFLCFRVGAPLIGGIEQTLNRESHQPTAVPCSSQSTPLSTVPQNYSATRFAASGKNIFSTTTIIPLNVRCPRSHFTFGGVVSVFVDPILFLKRLVPVSRDRVAFHLNQKPIQTITRLKLFLNSKDKSSLKIVCSVGSGRNVVLFVG